MKNKKRILALAVAATAALAMGMTSFAADETTDVPVDSENATAAASQTLTYDKQAAPAYTVTIPATVSLSAESQEIPFTMTLPEGVDTLKGYKISVSIASTNNGENTFSLKSSTGDKANYEIYYSDAMAGGRYAIGDEIVSWEPGNHGTQNRVIKALNTENLKPNSYIGSIEYSISMQEFSYN